MHHPFAVHILERRQNRTQHPAYFLSFQRTLGDNLREILLGKFLDHIHQFPALLGSATQRQNANQVRVAQLARCLPAPQLALCLGSAHGNQLDHRVCRFFSLSDMASLRTRTENGAVIRAAQVISQDKFSVDGSAFPFSPAHVLLSLHEVALLYDHTRLLDQLFQFSPPEVFRSHLIYNIPMSIPGAIHGKRYLSLATFRKTGVPVYTPIWFGEDDDKLYFMTNAKLGKIKRIRNNPKVKIAPCTIRGKITGPEFSATARILPPEEGVRVRRAIKAKYWLARVPFIWRNSDTYVEITPVVS